MIDEKRLNEITWQASHNQSWASLVMSLKKPSPHFRRVPSFRTIRGADIAFPST